MKKILFLLVFMCSLTTVFAQPSKSRKKLPPPKKSKNNLPPPPLIPKLKFNEPPKYPASLKLTDEEVIKRIFHAAESRTAFLWKIKTDEDQTVPEKTIYQEFVEISGAYGSGGIIISYATSRPEEFKKGTDAEKSIISSQIKYTDCSYTVSKNTLTLTDEKTKNTEKFLVFLDKRKEKILKIQNLKTEKFYFPSKPDPPKIMVVKIFDEKN